MIVEEGDDNQAMIMKGKRTKRPRLASPLTIGANSTSSSDDDHHRRRHHQSPERLANVLSLMSPCTSVDQLSEATVVQAREEEEDMANCLILLAQGGRNNSKLSHKEPHGISLVQELYQCKTCDRCFLSFQALGGHRASHKKPATIKQANDTTLSLQMPSSGTSHSAGGAVVKPGKVHECSICGAEFSSGQALGGHMRRHRPFPSPTANNTTTTITTTSSSSEELRELKKARTSSSLEMDLNLPAAPEEDHGLDTIKFHFASKEEVIVFSSSSLVDCHY